MLVVCALALVVAAAVFLVIGLAGGDVGDLYLSMVLCVASLAVVAVSARLSRIKAAPAASEPPEPVAPVGAAEAEADEEHESAPVPEPEPEPVGAAATASSSSSSAPSLRERLAKVDRPEPAPEPAADDGSIWSAAAPAEPDPQVEVRPEPQVEAEVEVDAPFPIADYDDLAAEQILPLVPELWPEEVPAVAARERATKARPAVLDALAAAGGDPSLGFPIAEYEQLDTEQITKLLDRLDAADLATVQAAERSGPARVGVLVAVANHLAARS